MRKILPLLAITGTSILGGCHDREYPNKYFHKQYQGTTYEVDQFWDGVVFVHMPTSPGELTKKLVNKDRDTIPDLFMRVYVGSDNPRVAKVEQRAPTEEEIGIFRELTAELYR